MNAAVSVDRLASSWTLIPAKSHAVGRDIAETELIRSVAAMLVPSTVMALAGLLVQGLIVWELQDSALAMLMLGGGGASAARLLLARHWVPRAAHADFSIVQARRFERCYAIPYVASLSLLGLFGMRTMFIASPDGQMLALTLLIANGTGAVVGMGLRPRIGATSVICVIAPLIVAELARPSLFHWVTAFLLAVMTAAGLLSLRTRHDRAREQIEWRVAAVSEARLDGLTALPNRRALQEHFQAGIRQMGRDELIAVHYLDLDGFKPVNDTYGHDVGDALLAAAGRRISRRLKGSDIVARLGGDEFAIVQYGLEESEDAELLAELIERAVGTTFQIHGHHIEITTTIGYVVSRPGVNLEKLLSKADGALCEGKRTGTSITRFRGDDFI